MAGSQLFSFPVGLNLEKAWISHVACGYGWFAVSKIFWKKIKLFPLVYPVSFTGTYDKNLRSCKLQFNTE